jgi:hypothetical protein
MALVGEELVMAVAAAAELVATVVAMSDGTAAAARCRVLQCLAL